MSSCGNHDNQAGLSSQASGDSVIAEIKDEGSMYVALAQANTKLLLACFTARWCRPCQAFAPKLEQLARKYSQVVFVKIDADKLSDVANEYGIRVLPTFVLFKASYRVGSVSATAEGKLEELLVHHGAFPSHCGDGGASAGVGKGGSGACSGCNDCGGCGGGRN